MIYQKTPAGVDAFQQRPSQLHPRLRSILIMIDGKKTSNELLAVLAAMGGTQTHLDELISLGLIQDIKDQQAATPSASSKKDDLSQASAISLGITALTDQQRYELAYPIATRLTAGLGLRGFRLNLSVEGAANIKDLILLAEKIKDAVGESKYFELKPYLQE
jgi:hypothetical protein